MGDYIIEHGATIKLTHKHLKRRSFEGVYLGDKIYLNDIYSIPPFLYCVQKETGRMTRIKTEYYNIEEK